MSTVKRAEGTNFQIQLEEGRFILTDGDKVMTSPGGTAITTGYEELADAFLKDISENGITFENNDSILCWHYNLLDKFIGMDMRQILLMIIGSLMNSPDRDWTFKCPYSDEDVVSEWEKVFGTKEEMEDRLQIVADWLNACTRMQLAGAYALSKLTDSFNIPYITAYAMEHEGDTDEAIQKIAEMIVKYRPGNQMEDTVRRLNMFRLYYGFHMDDIRRTDPIEGDGADEETAQELINELLK
ncbi:MAG: hypothetical protein IJV66_06490 [Firmicutes bacterium]|nr:hypothetical protein [Bacillota bacterium]